MSDADDTKRISVAELLAKNGTIGSPPVGGRRRRRRGNADAVTVAELTGEIPIIRSGAMPIVTDKDLKDAGYESAPEQVEEPPAEALAPESEIFEEAVEVEEIIAEDEPAVAEEPAAAEPAAEPEPEPEEPEESVAAVEVPPQRSSRPSPRRGGDRRPERSPDLRPLRRSLRSRPAPKTEEPAEETVVEEPQPAAVAAVEVEDAEWMSPDLADEVAVVDLELDADADDALFGGDSVADELARRRVNGEPEIVLDDSDAVDEDEAPPPSHDQPGFGHKLLRGLAIAAQSILAVALGGGLFLAFLRLWEWQNIIALVLSVLVILGLVVGVRIVRKTEDIASTLIAVVVGALITLGPLALLQSS
ncbi:hypothetical protein [Mycolicibacterium brumae]|uniref:FUSC family protein n=1 Tax=Mycolicibacterium brumae TaxID=85968 RepID=A0A2G5PGT7_9MYCO|nr:hypothetical protein [Mycolicibacterium brumae]MCV7192490.1 hypothetical protein [Mycolicibacterium brumae]PIB77511.1 hypothetical protein CQY22_000640 [Mycolicibacterium brumae]RWA18518.1 hypothetical protein MBRU_04685 [Mycolicibacterium brumae DSM 44177]UWW10258.1 hypothetical protein L2Z93_003385 [Mycolicibacterium brumae]